MRSSSIVEGFYPVDAHYRDSAMGRLRDLLRRRSGLVAFVLSGGGNHGAVQVGMLRSLVEHDVRPEIVLGSSIGAINGAAYAQDPTISGVARLEELWRGLDSVDLLPSSWIPNALALARRGEAVHSNDRLRGLLEGMLRVERFEDLEVPFQCVATDIVEAREVWFSAGDLVEPILASAALPAILPAVEIGGVRYLDGAIVNDVPISRAVALGAETIYVLHCGTIDRPRPEPKRPLDVVVQAYWVARRHRFKRDLENLPDGVEAIVLPLGDTPALRYNDFSHSAELIRSAYAASDRFLDRDVDDEAPLPTGGRPRDAASQEA
jgi:NTE family protein